MQQGKFKKNLSLLDLTFLGVGSIIGSGWLFASMTGASFAGGSSWIAWVAGAVAVLLIGIVYAELSAAIPRAGGFVRYPEYSHGSLVGFLIGFSSLLAYSSVAAIEVEAVRAHATYYLPMLSYNNGNPTLLGHTLEILLLVVFFLLNYWSVNVFGKINTIVTSFKFVVPTITIIVLFFYFKGGNFSIAGATPGGAHGIFEAIAGGGIVFAFLGFRQAVDFGAEAKNPQRDIPRAIFLAIALGTIVYLLLQVTFLGGVPTNLIAHSGWGQVANVLKGSNYPFVALASSLGVTWLATLLLVDAVISPAGTGNIYLSGTSRVIFAFSRNRYFYSIFAKVSPTTGIPRPAMWFTMILAIIWTLPSGLSSWQTLVGSVTSATVMTYMIGPVTMASLRRTMPNLHRPFRLQWAGVINPLAFIAATLIIYWSGWTTDLLLIGLTLGSLVLYFAFMDRDEQSRRNLIDHWKAGAWLVVYYLFILLLTYLGSFGPLANPVIPGPYLDSVVAAIGGLIFYLWGVGSALPKPSFDTDDESDAELDLRGV